MSTQSTLRHLNRRGEKPMRSEPTTLLTLDDDTRQGKQTL